MTATMRVEDAYTAWSATYDADANRTRDLDVDADVTVDVPAFVHHVSDFLDAASRAGLRLAALREWWHPDDRRGCSPWR